MQTMMIDVSSIIPQLGLGKGLAPGNGPTFAQVFDQLPDAFPAFGQEQELAGLLTALAAMAEEAGPEGADASLLETLLTEASSGDLGGQQALQALLERLLPLQVEAVEVPVAGDVAEDIATAVVEAIPAPVVEETLQPQIAVVPPADVAMAVAPQIPAQPPEPEVRVPNEPVVAGASASWQETLGRKAAEPVPQPQGPTVVATTTVAETEPPSTSSGTTPPLLDSMLEKLLGPVTAPRRSGMGTVAEGTEPVAAKEPQSAPVPTDIAGKLQPGTAPLANPLPHQLHGAAHGAQVPTGERVELPSLNSEEAATQGGQNLVARQAAMPEPAAVPGTGLRLSSGLMVPEEQIVDQVVGRLSLGRGRESNGLTMKLYPEELGEVKLSLLVDKDQVKAQLVVQSQQVQEVLDRNLPKLREALAQQGLKLEEVQVSVDSRQGDGHKGLFQEQPRHSTPFRFAVQRDGGPGPLELPAQGSVKTGLSIRI